MGTKKKRNPNKKQTNRRRITPLKRYNKIVSLVVKDYKKKGIEYNIADVRKDISESVYPRLKNVAPSKIRLKQVTALSRKPRKEVDEQEDTVKILAENIPREYFDISLEWFELGEESRNNGEKNPILEINKLYPEIPIVIKSGEHEIRLKGELGVYQNSLLQEFVEKLRNDFQNKSGFPFAGVPTWLDRKDKQYALWGTEDVAENLPPEKILDFQEADTRVFDLDEKGKTQEETKKPTPKEKPKKKPKEEPTTSKDKGQNVAKISADFREREKELLELFKEGVYTKEEFKAERKDLKNQLNLALSKFLKGGKI